MATVRWFNAPLLKFRQHTSVSPDDKLLVIIGEHPDSLLIDFVTGKDIEKHDCYCFLFHSILYKQGGDFTAHLTDPRGHLDYPHQHGTQWSHF